MTHLKWILLVAVSLVAAMGHATMVVPQSAQTLTEKAAVIFVGTCQNREVKAGTPDFTEYTFTIETVAKGALQPGEKFVVKQWGGTPPARSARMRIAGMPIYEPGRKYMVFLGPENASGLRAPVGMGQGVFQVLPSADGQTVVQNSLGNRWLFPQGGTVTPGKSVGPAPSQSLQLNDFVKTIRSIGGQP
jgi:hypothetical protein